MSTPVLTGKAAVFGLDGTMAYTGLATTENEPQSIDYTDQFTTATLKDKKGWTKGMAATDRQGQLTITFYPFDPASPSVLATARSKVVLPAMLATVTLASFSVDEIDGTYNYIGGGKIRLSNEGYIAMDLPLSRFGSDPTTSAALAATT